MDILNILFLGFALSADSFSAAVAMGFRPHTNQQSLKFATSSGLAEAIAALAGALAGSKIISAFGDYDHWIAFILLFAVASHMLVEAYEELKHRKDQPGESKPVGFHSFKKILLVSFATSLDALGVGIGLGVVEDSLWPYIVSIGFWAFSATIAGMYFARRVPKTLSPIFSFFGAGILFVLAFKVLEI